MSFILIINSSPRKVGNVSSMLKEVRKNLKDEEYEIEEVFLHDYQYAPCMGCMKCRDEKNCRLADSANEIAEKISKADILILGMPVYWGNIPGHLKNLLDRCVYVLFEIQKYKLPIAKTKSLYLVMSMNLSRTADFFVGDVKLAKKAIKEVFRYSKYKMRGSFVNYDAFSKGAMSYIGDKRLNRFSKKIK